MYHQIKNLSHSIQLLKAQASSGWPIIHPRDSKTALQTHPMDDNCWHLVSVRGEYASVLPTALSPGDPHQEFLRVKYVAKTFPSSFELCKFDPNGTNYALTLQIETLSLVKRSPKAMWRTRVSQKPWLKGRRLEPCRIPFCPLSPFSQIQIFHNFIYV